MTVEIYTKNSLDTTMVTGDFSELVNNLNLAAATGRQFALAQERLPDGTVVPVALNTQNIIKFREIEGDGAFIGS